MTDIFLAIPDAALFEAVAEQIAAARLGEVRLCDDARAPRPGLYIVDAACPVRPVPPEGSTLLLLGAEEDAGASETFPKPFRLGHLLARLRYYVETAPLLRDKPVDFGPYRLEPQSRRVAGETLPAPVRLTEKETALLKYLGRHPEGVSRRDLLAEIWGYDERIDTHTLETHIYQLRRKLDGEGWLINENGLYRLARGQA